MSDALAFYENQARTRMSSVPWVVALQQQALADFARLGFPNRHQEDWKYTTMDPFLKEQFDVRDRDDGRPLSTGQRLSSTSRNPQDKRQKVDTGAGIDTARYANTETGASLGAVSPALSSVPPFLQKIRCANGQVLFDFNKKFKSGVLIEPIAKAIVEHAALIQPYLGQLLSHQHGFQALNTAMLHLGVVIYIPSGVQLEDPIYLTHWQDKDNEAVYLRHLVIAEPGSSLCLIEDYQGADKQSYFTSAITEVFVGQAASVTHYKIQRESQLSYHISHLAIEQQANSQMHSHLINLGGKCVRSDTSIALKGPHANCLLNGIYMPQEGQHMDHHTTVEHRVPFCRSEQDYKGVLAGHSRAVFNGKVIVEKDAQHSEARQQNKNILLSTQAEIDTKPQLEIFANDVTCTHGATVGQLDEEAIFYMATRGIDRQEASRRLVQAFIQENTQRMAHSECADWMRHLLNQQPG